MKKSNVIITVVLAAVSIFLLALWYMLGFNEIDSPLDLVISVVWWAVIVAGMAVAAKTESTRRQRIRTVYVADGAFYNSEAGNRIWPPASPPPRRSPARWRACSTGSTRPTPPPSRAATSPSTTVTWCAAPSSTRTHPTAPASSPAPRTAAPGRARS